MCKFKTIQVKLVPQQLARDCTMKIGQKSNVQQADSLLFSIQLFSPVLFMQYVPQPFMFIHSSLNSVLKHFKPVRQKKKTKHKSKSVEGGVNEWNDLACAT